MKIKGNFVSKKIGAVNQARVNNRSSKSVGWRLNPQTKIPMVSSRAKDPLSIISVPEYFSINQASRPVTTLHFDKPKHYAFENLAYIKLDHSVANHSVFSD